MGVIAPEKGTKVKAETVGKRKGNLFFTLLFVLLMIIIPVVLIETLSSRAVKSAGTVEEVYEAESYTAAQTENPVESSTISSSVGDREEVESNKNVLNLMEHAAKYESDAEGFYGKTIQYDKRNNRYDLTGPVVDSAKILSRKEYVKLASVLLACDRDFGFQIAVLTVNSMKGEDIESFSMKHAEYWKLGESGKDNGVLVTVCMDDHSIRIETGYGTEGVLTDALCSRIIRRVIVPAFQSDRYGAGLLEAVENIAGIVLEDDSLVTVKNNSAEDSSDELPVIVIIIFMIIIVSIIISSTSGRGRRGRRGPMIFMGPTFTSSSKGFGGSSGGFGGFSGGGGHFGGGGASGHW